LKLEGAGLLECKFGVFLKSWVLKIMKRKKKLIKKEEEKNSRYKIRGEFDLG